MKRGAFKRKAKRRLNRFMKSMSGVNHIIDCRYHPCEITKIGICKSDPWASDFDCISLLDGTPNSCSIMHCGPEPITEKMAHEMVEFCKENGFFAYLAKYCYHVELTEELRKEWTDYYKSWNWVAPYEENYNETDASTNS